ncbi:phasin family protein [Salipiger sp. HF18]|uniref:hypothetical protein n=1 Tax=Salipiger sp. HF18 TaxID=2721557 RepID=UPI00058D5060|nr:hypothetical protein [Salipiger sp. HF18]NIY98298.1 phasin family protein [Salipiger sp. HF18]
MTDEQILELAEAYAERRQIKLSTLGAYAARDGKFFEQLKAGRELRRHTRAKLAKWFDRHWFEDLEWPQAIPRPTSAPESGSPM